MKRFIILLAAVLAAPATPSLDARPRRDGAASAFSAPTARTKSAHASAENLPTGRIVERVTTLFDAGQSYALYLPSNYTPERQWPILYCFDPVARGAVPVRLFSEAAERYGWIVVGSNNSRNGPLKDSFAAVAAMWEDAQRRFAVDARRVYTTGFSGGARLAVRVNFICQGCLAGVIACGAGFPPDIKPDGPIPFAFYGMAGVDDYNYPELKLLDGTLDRLGATRHFSVFDGGHQWAPKEVCAEAIEWMELQAIKSGRRKKDDALVETIWQKRAAEGREHEAANKILEAYRAAAALVSDFRALRDVTEFEAKLAQSKEAKALRAAVSAEQEEMRRQGRKAAELVQLIEQRNDADRRMLAVSEFKHALEELRKKAREATDSGGRRVARRVLNQVFAQYYEGALNLRQRPQDAALMATTLEIAAEFAPDSPQIHYELARAYALKAERKKALAALRAAIERGFKDAAALAGEKAFDPLRAQDEYKALVEKLKTNP
ncbi:MAG: TPR end-of-group domain-containing protein [Pyrinomonadaceae bacterium]